MIVHSFGKCKVCFIFEGKSLSTDLFEKLHFFTDLFRWTRELLTVEVKKINWI